MRNLVSVVSCSSLALLKKLSTTLYVRVRSVNFMENPWKSMDLGFSFVTDFGLSPCTVAVKSSHRPPSYYNLLGLIIVQLVDWIVQSCEKSWAAHQTLSVGISNRTAHRTSKFQRLWANWKFRASAVSTDFISLVMMASLDSYFSSSLLFWKE